MKKAKKEGEACCNTGKGCPCGCAFVLALIILVLALVPSWYGTMWAKWVIVVAAILLLLSKFCPCHKK
ncbi:MAG: hypothetical protein ABIH37_03415 [archaeon]